MSLVFFFHPRLLLVLSEKKTKIQSCFNHNVFLCWLSDLFLCNLVAAHTSKSCPSCLCRGLLSAFWLSSCLKTRRAEAWLVSRFLFYENNLLFTSRPFFFFCLPKFFSVGLSRCTRLSALFRSFSPACWVLLDTSPLTSYQRHFHASLEIHFQKESLCWLPGASERSPAEQE